MNQKHSNQKYFIKQESYWLFNVSVQCWRSFINNLHAKLQASPF